MGLAARFRPISVRTKVASRWANSAAQNVGIVEGRAGRAYWTKMSVRSDAKAGSPKLWLRERFGLFFAGEEN